MTEELRQKLYERCGRSTACRRAVDYYIALLQNPCYPPSKMTYRMRQFYMEIVKEYGLPPRCDVGKLVVERLRGTMLEGYAYEVAEFAEVVKNRFHMTSRVAAAVAAVVVAESHGVAVVRASVAERFGASHAAVLQWIKKAYELYSEYIKARRVL
jgi:hypothetical protein